MSLAQASRTMLRTVALRAAHQRLEYPPIFADPVAPQLVSETLAGEVADTMGDDNLALRTIVALRSRFAEDRLEEAAARNVTQYVMIGAGLETFPWRQPVYAQKMHIFAADHPSSLAWVRRCLQEQRFDIPANLTMVPVDLEEDCIGDRLKAAGFDARVPAFCSALGLTQYLTRQALDRLIAFAATLAIGSEIVLSFVPIAADLRDEDASFVARALKRVSAVGEPWKTRLSASEFAGELRAHGFSDVFHLTPEAACTRYFAARRDRITPPGFEQMISAVV